MNDPAWISISLQLLRDGAPMQFALSQPLVAWTAEPSDLSSVASRIVDRLTFRHEIGRQAPARELADFLRPYVGTWLAKRERQLVTSYRLHAGLVGDSTTCFAQREVSRELLMSADAREVERHVGEQLLQAACEQIIERVMTGQVGRG